MEFICNKKQDLHRILGGYIHKQTTGIAAVLVWQNMMFISSEIAEKNIDLSIELPAHRGFYLEIKKEASSRRMFIEKNKNLNFTLLKGECIFACAPYTGGI